MKTSTEIETPFGRYEILESETTCSLLTACGAYFSEYDKSVPQRLGLVSHQHLLTGLLFYPELPQRILLAGIGGGDCARALTGLSAEIAITGVDIDPVLLQVAKTHFALPDIECVCADIRDFICHDQQHYDLIIVDIFQEAQGLALNSELLRAFQARLSAQGILSFNLTLTDTSMAQPLLHDVQQCFATRFLMVDIARRKNVFLHCFHAMPSIRQRHALLTRAQVLSNTLGFSFTNIVARLFEKNPTDSQFASALLAGDDYNR